MSGVPEQVLKARDDLQGLVCHGDSRYLSIRYSEGLAEAGIGSAVGNRGDPCDNALAETIKVLYKTDVIHRCGPWRHPDAVDHAMLEWVDWFSDRRLLERIGHVAPAEFEAAYHRQQNESAMVA